MELDTKAKLIVVAASVTVVAVSAAITHKIKQTRNTLCDPLPGTTKVERLIIKKQPRKK